MHVYIYQCRLSCSRLQYRERPLILIWNTCCSQQYKRSDVSRVLTEKCSSLRALNWHRVGLGSTRFLGSVPATKNPYQNWPRMASPLQFSCPCPCSYGRAYPFAVVHVNPDVCAMFARASFILVRATHVAVLPASPWLVRATATARLVPSPAKSGRAVLC